MELLNLLVYQELYVLMFLVLTVSLKVQPQERPFLKPVSLGPKMKLLCWDLYSQQRYTGEEDIPKSLRTLKR